MTARSFEFLNSADYRNYNGRLNAYAPSPFPTANATITRPVSARVIRRYAR